MNDTELLDWFIVNWQSQEFYETLESINDPTEFRKKAIELKAELEAGD